MQLTLLANRALQNQPDRSFWSTAIHSHPTMTAFGVAPVLTMSALSTVAELLPVAMAAMASKAAHQQI